MDFLSKLQFFSRTFENRFVFSLFDLLLCGVILLVIFREQLTQERTYSDRSRTLLFLAFSCLGTSFFLQTVFTGALLFFKKHLVEAPFDLSMHSLWAASWILLAASAYQRPPRVFSEATRNRTSAAFVFLTPLWLFLALALLSPIAFNLAQPLARLYPGANIALDLMNFFLLAGALFLYYRRPLGGQTFATGAVTLLFLAALLHASSYLATETGIAVGLWNLEQFTLSFSLLICALAIGETGRDLFYRVFVRLQIAFIVLAGSMTLVITHTENQEYLASLRARSDQLAELVRMNADYLTKEEQPLSDIMSREDFLQRAMLGLGSMPELKLIRVAARGQAATFEVSDNGEIRQGLENLTRSPRSELDSDDYFSIRSLPLAGAGPGEVAFYGTRELLYENFGKHIVLIFSLFTGMVLLSTVMIGLVVRGASATISQQEREIEETQRRLLQASKLAAIGQLAAGVAHEINNPATVILSRASFLRSDESVDAAAREDLEAIVAQAQRIAQVTDSLLTFSRPQARDVKRTRIADVIDNSLSLVKESANANGVVVERNLRPDLPPVLADQGSLTRALENLFRNSIDAMPKGGRLGVCASRDRLQPSQVRIEVSDTGIGIRSENLARVFDPFFTTKEVGKGTGLGLSIVHGIIEEHHGSITVESEPEKGTTFKILLPAEGS